MSHSLIANYYWCIFSSRTKTIARLWLAPGVSALWGMRKTLESRSACRTQRRPLLPCPLLRCSVRSAAIRTRNSRRIAQELRGQGSPATSRSWFCGTLFAAGSFRVEAESVQSVLQQSQPWDPVSGGQRTAGTGGSAADLLGRSGSDPSEGGRRPADGDYGAQAELVSV